MTVHKTQLSVLNAMGISSWQRAEPGEVAAPEVRWQPTPLHQKNAHFLIFVAKDDLVLHRSLFQAILAALAWPVSSYRVLSDPAQLAMIECQSLTLVCWLIPADEQAMACLKSNPDLVQIHGACLAEMARNPKAKAELWQALKPHQSND